MKAMCETYGADVMAHLEGNLEGAARDRLETHLAACEGCREAIAAYRGLEGELQVLGAALDADVPHVDLLPGIVEGLAALRGGQRALRSMASPEDAAAMAFVEGDLDDLAQARFERTVTEDENLADEVADLQAMHTELESLATAQKAPESVDLVDAVMARVAERRTAEQADIAVPEAAGALLDAYMEDTLDEDGLIQLGSACAENAAVQTEFDALRTLKADLEAMGDAAKAGAPSVDLVDDVMRAVHTDAAPEVVPFRARPKPEAEHIVAAKRGFRWEWAGMAAAAGLLIALGLMLWPSSAPDDTPGMRIARMTPPETRDGFRRTTFPPRHAFEASVDPPSETPPELGPTETPPNREEALQRLKGVSLQDAIDARRASLLDDAGALGKLAQWASLGTEEARALLATVDLNSGALIGATQFLPPEEAAAILRAAISENSDDPFLRYALAGANGTDSASAEETHGELAAWSELDPENALPGYMEANLYFAEGDHEAALAVLGEAALYGQLSSYALQAAGNHEAALRAAGMPADTAAFLAASAAGSNEYHMLGELGDELMQYGEYYEGLGDLGAAGDIYSAVQALGQQIVSGADMANEELAGYDLQLSATTAIQGLYDIFAEPQTQQILQATYEGIAVGLSGLDEFFTAYSEFMNDSSYDVISEITRDVLTGGDLGYFGQ